MQFRAAVLDAMSTHVGYDGACLASTDPASLVPTQLLTVGYDDPRALPAAIAFEYGGDPQPSSFEAMARRGTPIRTIREVTPGPVPASRFYAELLAPFGLRDELRMLFRARDGRTWGVCTLSRGPGREFGSKEVATLSAVLDAVGDGIRSTLFRQGVPVVGQDPGGPAVAIVGADNEFEAVSPAAEAYFERLGWGALGRPLTEAPALFAAAWLRRSGRDHGSFRVRTVDGQWLDLQVGRLDHAHPPRRIVVTVNPAELPAVASLLAAAHGLTAREVEVLTQLLAGKTRNEIACDLVLSPHTVQDHLKSIYGKVGVHSRPRLIAQLVHTQYVPRIGSQLRSDGWFTNAHHPATPGSRHQGEPES